MKQILISILSVTLLAAGCGDDESSSDPASGPLVSYQRSGGVAGVLEELRVSADGQATITVDVEGTRGSFALEELELERLRSELEAADLSNPDFRPGGAGCADCFEYTVEADGSQVRLDDLDRPGEALAALLDHLGQLVADNPPGAGPEEAQ